MKKSYLTFDIDFTDYFTGELFDEFKDCYQELMNCFNNYPTIKTTWFIRIDSQIEKLYGSGDYFINSHKDEINELQRNGHEIGWHHHSYTMENGKWIQDTNEEIICADLKKYGLLAMKHGIKISRMGWGYHTNETMKVISDLGFTLDSSAIPRPQYKWELSKKDWSMTGQDLYNPSLQNYQIQGENNLKVVQVPINTIGLSLPTDTEKGVIRYINPAYKHEIFVNAVNEFFKTRNRMVLVCHPYEILKAHDVKHPLLSFTMDDFKKNLEFLKESPILTEIIKNT